MILMGFKFKKIKLNIGDTPVNNIFIQHFMKDAGEDYLKVYLLGLSYAFISDEEKFENIDLANELDLSPLKVREAWEYWKEAGIVDFTVYDDEINFDVVFKDLKTLYMNISEDKQESYEDEKTGTDIDRIVEANRDEEVRTMFMNVQHIIRRTLNTPEKKKILIWLTEYNMTPDMIAHAFSYAYDILNKKSVNYVEGIIVNWYDKKLTSLEEVAQDFTENENKLKKYKDIFIKMGMRYKDISPYDREIIDRWYEEYEYPQELIDKALEKTVYARSPSLAYVDGVIKNWYNNGVRTLEDADKFDSIYKEIKKADKAAKSKPSSENVFNNFKQREYDDDDELEKKYRKNF